VNVVHKCNPMAATGISIGSMAQYTNEWWSKRTLTVKERYIQSPEHILCDFVTPMVIIRVFKPLPDDPRQQHIVNSINRQQLIDQDIETDMVLAFC